MGAERDHHGVVAGRRLELEVEADAELLAQGVAHRPVDAAAAGRVDDQLHAVGIVEEALHHQIGGGGHDPQRRPPGGEVVHDEGRRIATDARFRDQPRRGARRVVVDQELARPEPAGRTPPRRAPRCGPAPRRSRTGRSAAVAGIDHPDLTPRSTWRIATNGCRAGRCRPPSTPIAQSSLTVPTNVSSGSATTR